MRREIYHHLMLPPSRVQHTDGKRHPPFLPPSWPPGRGGGRDIVDAVPAQGIQLAKQLGMEKYEREREGGGTEGGRKESR